MPRFDKLPSHATKSGVRASFRTGGGILSGVRGARGAGVSADGSSVSSTERKRPPRFSNPVSRVAAVDDAPSAKRTLPPAVRGIGRIGGVFVVTSSAGAPAR